MGWQMPVSCFDCHCHILSDPVLDVLDTVDWGSFLFLERCQGRGRHSVYGRIGLLRALLYMELSRIPSVHELLRFLGRNLYKMKVLGLDHLPSDSVFSRFKRRLGGWMDRLVGMLTGMLSKNEPRLIQKLGVDSTKLEAYTYKDGQAGWGYDHVDKKMYKGYKVHLLYDTGLLAPLAYTVTSARVHDNRQLHRLTGKLGAGILKTLCLFADSAYDSKANVENYAGVGITVVCRKNKRKAKKLKGKYRVQDYSPADQDQLDHLYKNRNDCEVVNGLLKEHLRLEDTKTRGILRNRVKAGLTILARQIQVLHQLRHKANTRTTIIN
jgi:hypothetical protein